MNYYEHHLGDWAAATGHLSWDEDMAYTRLLRAYYHHERAIPEGQQYRLAKASTPAQRKAVDQVLREFFELRDGHHHQKRADAEIAKYHETVPEREAKRENERERQRRARERRKALFDILRQHGVIPPYDATTNELQTLVSRAASQPVTRDVTHPVTRDNTATHTQSQTPVLEDPPTPAKRGNVHDFPPGFEAFWTAYPRKTAKPKALQAFARLKPNEALLATILAAVRFWAASEQWTKDGGQFIPHPATWLNGRRWEDQMPGAGAADDRFGGAL